MKSLKHLARSVLTFIKTTQGRSALAVLWSVCLLAGSVGFPVIATQTTYASTGGWGDDWMCLTVNHNTCNWASTSGNLFLETVSTSSKTPTAFTDDYGPSRLEIVQEGTNRCITFNAGSNLYDMVTCQNLKSQQWNFLYGSSLVDNNWALKNLYNGKCMKYNGLNKVPTPAACADVNNQLWTPIAIP